MNSTEKVSLGFGCMRLPVLEGGKPDSFDEQKIEELFDTSVWLFGFGVGFAITWSYYLSGKWQKNSAITAA